MSRRRPALAVIDHETGRELMTKQWCGHWVPRCGPISNRDVADLARVAATAYAGAGDRERAARFRAYAEHLDGRSSHRRRPRSWRLVDMAPA